MTDKKKWQLVSEERVSIKIFAHSVFIPGISGNSATGTSHGIEMEIGWEPGPYTAFGKVSLTPPPPIEYTDSQILDLVKTSGILDCLHRFWPDKIVSLSNMSLTKPSSGQYSMSSSSPLEISIIDRKCLRYGARHFPLGISMLWYPKEQKVSNIVVENLTEDIIVCSSESANNKNTRICKVDYRCLKEVFKQFGGDLYFDEAKYEYIPEFLENRKRGVNITIADTAGGIAIDEEGNHDDVSVSLSFDWNIADKTYNNLKVSEINLKRKKLETNDCFFQAKFSNLLEITSEYGINKIEAPIVLEVIGENGDSYVERTVATNSNYDVFICYASDSKLAMAEPLAEKLRDFELSVWFDDFCVTPGDSIHEKINEGLSNCETGIVIISEEFLQREWPEKELSGLLNSGKIIIPIWFNVDEDYVKSKMPLISGIRAVRGTDPDKVSEELYRSLGRN